MSFEASNDLEGGGEDPNIAVFTADENVFRSRADRAELVALAQSATKLSASSKS